VHTLEGNQGSASNRTRLGVGSGYGFMPKSPLKDRNAMRCTRQRTHSQCRMDTLALSALVVAGAISAFSAVGLALAPYVFCAPGQHRSHVRSASNIGVASVFVLSLLSVCVGYFAGSSRVLMVLLMSGVLCSLVAVATYAAVLISINVLSSPNVRLGKQHRR
jgi:hypothetical protein